MMASTNDTILRALRRELSEAEDNLYRCRLQLRAFDQNIHPMGRTQDEHDEYKQYQDYERGYAAKERDLLAAIAAIERK